jgi:UDP-N-acetylmuramoyl-tripeptide--D-alanyl-D-alanine ligase
LGEESESEHQQILDLALSLNFDQIITVGPHFKKSNSNGNSFEKTDDLIAFLQKNTLSSDNILLKASRGIALEKVLDYIK